MGLLEEMNEKAAKELKEREVSIAKKHRELDSKIHGFITELKEHTEIAHLHQEISRISETLKRFNIPEKIALKTSKHVQFENGTKKFLWKYFIVSGLVNVFFIGLFVYFQAMPKWKEYKEGYSKGHTEGQIEMTKYLVKEMPTKSSDWIKNNVKSAYWK